LILYVGANIDVGDLKNYFPHPISGRKVFVILDASHMLKLMRNILFECLRMWLPGFFHPAEWDHFDALHEDQTVIGFRAGNKLTDKHVNPTYHKMNRKTLMKRKKR